MENYTLEDVIRFEEMKSKLREYNKDVALGTNPRADYSDEQWDKFYDWAGGELMRSLDDISLDI